MKNDEEDDNGLANTQNSTGEEESDDGSSASSPSWQGFYRCDDMLPPICDDDLTVTTGRVETIRGVHVKYWRYTPSSSLKSTKSPILVMNGGPGLPHNYVKPTRNLACDGREVVMYDQAGTGASQLSSAQNAQAAELFPELFTIEYYAEIEVPALIDALGWQSYHILGSSWGTQIALQYAVSLSYTGNNHGGGLQSLILNAPIADNRKFIEYQWDPIDGSIGSLPTFIQERLQSFNETRDGFGSEEFQFLQNLVMQNFNARLGVLVDCWMETEDAGISNLDLDRMTGPTDLFLPDPTATLHRWSVLSKLHRLKDIPVQLNYGRYDMVRPRLISETVEALGGGSLVECHELPRAAHALLLDAPREVYPLMQDFLIRVEESSSSSQAFLPQGDCPLNKTGSDPWSSLRVAGQSQIDTISSDCVLSKTSIVGLSALILLSFGMVFKLGMLFERRRRSRRRGYNEIVEIVGS